MFRLCTSYSPDLNFSSTRTSSIKPQTVKTGTGNVMAPEMRWGNCERGKWMDELFSASMSAWRPEVVGMDRRDWRVPLAMRGEY